MVNKHQFQMLAKSFRAGKISLSEFTEQAFNPPADSSASKPSELEKAKADDGSESGDQVAR